MPKIFGSAQKKNDTAIRNRRWQLGADIDPNGALRIIRLPGGSHHADGNIGLVIHQQDTTLNPIGLDVIQEGTGAAIRFKSAADDTVVGRISAEGVVTPSSSETVKDDFKPVSHKLVEKMLNKLSVKSWVYRKRRDERMVGPTAENFQEITGFGDGTGVNSITLLGLTILMVQFVWRRVQKLEKQVSPAPASKKQTASKKPPAKQELKEEGLPKV